MSDPLVLGIESSCDETGVGIVRGRTLLTNTVSSSMDEHVRFGGVVPEVASRAHVQAIGPAIVAACDEAGVAVQVLSPGGPGPDLVPGPDGAALARAVNDQLAAACAKHPTRFVGFATLPMATPDACADELRRCVKELKFPGAMVNGTTDGRFLDHQSYDSLLAAAVELDVPIYIHPHLPPPAVQPVGRILPHHVANISLYHIAEAMGSAAFPNFVVHYPHSPLKQCIANFVS